MAEKQWGISASFYLQLGIIASIVCSSIVGFTYLGTLIEKKIDDRITPIVSKIKDLEDKIEDHEQLLADNKENVRAAFTSLNAFIEYYNRVYNKEFLRPVDITSRSIESMTPKKRRK